MYRAVLLAIVAVAVTSCATPYKSDGLMGGFDAKELREDVYRVRFGGNGFTTRETAQTYWLYQCAELTLEKGYYGFEILSDMRLTMGRPSHDADDPHEAASPRGRMAAHLMYVPASPSEFAEAARLRLGSSSLPSGEAGALSPVRVARGGAVFIYTPMATPYMPSFEGDIHLLRKPFESAPPKLFAANALKAALDDYVKSDKCGYGNVCPHVHEYLLPKGKLQPR